MKTIVLTGGGTAGHIMPHLAISSALKKNFDKIYYIGSKNGMEQDIIKNAGGFEFFDIDCAKLDRTHPLKNIGLPIKFIKSYHQAKKLLKEIKPNIIFSKGGYVSLPVVFAAKSLKIPVIAHESDLTLGLANRLSKICACKICTTFEKTAKDAGKKGEYTGSPIINKKSSGIVIETNKPILLITGGSLGSKIINQNVWGAIPNLTKQFYVIHQVGKNNLNKNINNPDYKQIEFSNNMQELMKLSSVVVSRAGSNTIFELAYLNKPMLLIPLPRGASRGDQVDNAKYFNKHGYAKILFQEEMTPESLINCINSLYLEQNQYIKRLNNAKIPNATDKIVELLVKYSK